MSTNTEKSLRKIEITTEVKTAIQNIENDKIEENNRFEGIERLKEKHSAKETELEHLEAAAKTALAAGDDPLAYISQIGSLKKELETIDQFIPKTKSAADERAEYARKKDLRQALADSLRIAFCNSTFKEEVNQEIQSHLEEVKRLSDQWDEVWGELFSSHKIQSGLVSKINVKLENTLLGRWVTTDLSGIEYSK